MPVLPVLFQWYLLCIGTATKTRAVVNAMNAYCVKAQQENILPDYGKLALAIENPTI